MAKRTPILVSGAAVLATLLVALWFALRPRMPAAQAAGETAQDVRAPAAATSDDLAQRVSGESSPAAREEAAASGAPEAGAPATTAKRADVEARLEAREWILFRVKNDQGVPVGGAEIQLTGLRTRRERGSHYGWRGDPSLGKTAVDGTLKLAYPVWVNLDDESGEISFVVRHPDYATLNDWGREVAPVIDVVLRSGSVLVISGWIDSTDRVVTDVTPHFTHDVDISKEDWLPRRDGRLTTTRVPPGTHILYLEWQSPDRGLCFSELTEFPLGEGQELELHLELRPAKTLEGRLADEVPRPVVEGQVVLGVQLQSKDPTHGSMLRTFGAEVNPDGTFEIAGVLSGEAQIVGLCDGWASRAESGAEPDQETSSDLPPMGPTMGPTIDLASFEGTYVLEMEPTATLEVLLRRPDGEPAPGVEVHAWPNVCWRVHVCGTYPGGRTFRASSDATGLARIEHIPAGQHWFGITDREYDLPLEAPTDRMRSAGFRPGETVRLTLTLERKDGR